jgi:positive regulator of sigma E activity
MPKQSYGFQACGALALLTALTAITSIVLYNTVILHTQKGSNVNIYLVDTKEGDTLQNSVIVILVFSLLLLLNAMLMPQFLKNNLVSMIAVLLCLGLLIGALFAVSGTLRIQKYQDVSSDKLQFNVLNVLSYMTGSFGLVSSLVCGLINFLVVLQKL